MKPRLILLIALTLLGLALAGTAQTVQYVTLYGSGTNFQLRLQKKQVVSLVGYDWYLKPYLIGKTVDGTELALMPFSTTSSSLNGSQLPQMVTGLTNITLSGSAGWATFQVTTPETAGVVSNYVPADAIVIPSSVTGDVQIILESSTDLVNWTAANPGIYGPSSATNRFFRVRAVVK